MSTIGPKNPTPENIPIPPLNQSSSELSPSEISQIKQIEQDIQAMLHSGTIDPCALLSDMDTLHKITENNPKLSPETLSSITNALENLVSAYTRGTVTNGMVTPSIGNSLQNAQMELYSIVG